MCLLQKTEDGCVYRGAGTAIPLRVMLNANEASIERGMLSARYDGRPTIPVFGRLLASLDSDEKHSLSICGTSSQVALRRMRLLDLDLLVDRF